MIRSFTAPAGRPAHAAPKRLNLRAAGWALCATLVAVITLVVALPAIAAPTAFVVTNALVGTSTATSGANIASNDTDTNPGDGLCLSYAGGCTLKAAIQEANAEFAASSVGTFTISFDPSLQGTSSAPTVVPFPTSTTSWMAAYKLSDQDTRGGVYKITAPTTIDFTGMSFGGPGLGNSSSVDNMDAAWFVAAGPDITLQNFWGGIYAPESAIVAAYNATNLTVQNGTWTPSNYYPERLLTMQTGVKGVTARNLNLRGGYASSNSYQTNLGGYFTFTNGYSGASTSSTPSPNYGSNFTNIVIGPNVQINQPTSDSWSCSASNATGCYNSILGWDAPTAWDNEPTGSTTGSGTNAVPAADSKWAFDGFTFSGNMVSGLPAKASGLCFASGDGGLYTVGASRNFTITDNVFRNLVGDHSPSPGGCNRSPGTYGAGLIVLPRFLSGTNTISNNVFQSMATSASAGLNDAILYFGNAKTVNNTTASGLSITNNHFDGWVGDSVIQLVDAGLVSVRGNTFGASNNSQSTNNGAGEEYTTSTGTSGTTVLINNRSGSSSGYATNTQTTNQAVRTWYPTAVATVLTSLPSASALPLGNIPQVIQDMTQCMVSMPISRNSATDGNSQGTQGLPVGVDVYWTSGRTAEVYLGSATVTSGTSATLTVPLPVGMVSLPMVGPKSIVGSPELPAPAPYSSGTATIVDPTTGVVRTGYLRLQTQVLAGGSQGLGQDESSQFSR